MALVIGGKFYTIVSVVPDASDPHDATKDKMYVDHKVVVPAAAYSIVIPALQWEFDGGVKQVGSVEGGVDTSIGSSLVVTPSARIPPPSIV